MNSVLMVAFHYPPCAGGSGIHRTLKFSRYLPQYGWKPVVLSAHPRAYSQLGDDQLGEIPTNARVVRAFALDAGRHLSIKGSYLRFTALPDRWASWWVGAIPAGLRIVRQDKPKVIWSTYPIATAHRIAYSLHRRTGLPWVADFRDSMTEDNYPRDAAMRQCYLKIEQQAVKYATRLVFTTDSTKMMYLQRYPELDPQRCLVIPNGYDESDFIGIKLDGAEPISVDRPIRLLHAGVIYPDDRDPRPFFRALTKLKREGLVSPRSLRVDLRASGSEQYYQALIDELEVSDMVFLLPSLPYRQSLQDCAEADALLVFQAQSCNHQIPAKVYEYLRLGKPILAITAAKGDTAAVLRTCGGATILDLTNEHELYAALMPFLTSVRSGAHALPNRMVVQRYSRMMQTHELAACLSRIIAD